MNDHATNEESPANPAAPDRLLVRDASGVALTIVSIERVADARRFQLTNASEPALRATVQEYVDSRVGAVPHATEADELTALASHLQSRGYGITSVPTGDFQLKFALDLDSGRTIGVSEALHPLAQMREGLDRDLAAAMKRAIEQPSHDAADKIRGGIEAGDHDGAAATLVDWPQRGLPIPTADLVDASRLIDRTRVDPNRQVEFARTRVAILSRNDPIAAADDAQFLLTKDEAAGEADRMPMKLTVGLGELRRGRKQSAFAIFRGVAMHAATDDSNRAWAYRNLAMILGPNEPQCAEYASLSRVLFLACGKRDQAHGSLQIEVECRLRSDPRRALDLLEDAAAAVTLDDLQNRGLGGWMSYYRGETELRLGRVHEGHQSALRAATILRPLIGAESLMLSVLVLAARTAEQLELDSEPFHREHEQLAHRVFGPEADVRRRLVALVEKYDSATAAAIRAEPAVSENPLLRAMLDTMRATYEPGLSHEEKVRLLESADAIEREEAGSMPRAALHALANEMMDAGEFDQALGLYRELLELDPIDFTARQNVAALLQRLHRHRELVVFLEREAAAWGPAPGIQTRLGRALLDLGEYTRAATVLAHVVAREKLPEAIARLARDLLAKAVGSGGVVASEPPTLVRPVMPAEFERALADFSEFVKTDERKRFWVQGAAGTYKWIKRPETRARDLLHTFLNGRFRDRMEGFEEVNAGAGRIDLYCIFTGGTRAIIELKMLGHGYASTYAFSGTEQVTHYMDNRRCHVGYVLIFDSRTKEFGERPAASTVPAPNTVNLRIVDVRPDVKPS